ncbi:family 43 glycosylhydrolase [Streptosporangium amethystogenes]|uniref:family 43 glycosylhydrolase n=1 Tax=Streptosporangium amethystogenes TaxID=2002 RepID=UPI001B8071E0|nr:RICIN domain-containing protein [Streptosporangium amethystogenes]
MLLLSLSCIATLTAPAQAVGETTFRNPLLADGADPWLQYHEGNYYLASTTWNSQLVMRKSPTLAGLRTAAPQYVWSDTSAGACCNFWAFEFHRLNGPSGTRWYLMYTSGQSGTLDHQHLSVLESAGDDPLGPYSPKGSPMPGTWNIDGSYLQLNGQLYLLWSEWQGADQSMWVARMTNPWTITGSKVLISRPTYGWETVGGRVNEGPEVLQRGGKTFIVYSASSCNTPDYKLGMLTLTGGDPLSASSWTKSANPVFQRGNGVYGPGHNGFFTSPDGSENWIVYHGNASTSQGCGNTRSTRAQKFTWNADGTPNFGTPAATTVDLPVPSGERGPFTVAVKGAAYTLVNRNSGLCLATTGGSGADGANVAQHSCTGSAAQWVLDSTADGYHRLVNKQSNKVLDLADCGTADGADVRQWAWLDNTCQQWRLQPVGTAAVVSAQSGKVLDVADCSTGNDANVRQWPWLGTACQKWTFTHTDNGYQRIHPVHSGGSCLVVNAASTADGADVAQGTCSGTNAQWRLEALADGSVRFVARHSGKALDLANCGLADGTDIAQWSWLNNICQRFHLRAT